MAPLLDVQHLVKNLPGFSLKDISFSLEPGYIMGIVGVNGSGKTTLLHTILNLYQPDGGTVHVAGIPMFQGEKVAKNKIGTVLEHDFFEESWSPKKNAKIWGRFYSDFSLEIFYKACERFEIPLSQKVGALSKGTRRKLQLAFAIAHQPLLYLMDEPSDGLDPQFRKNLLVFMQELVESQKRSVIFSTHLTEDLDKIADYILLLHKGTASFFLNKEELSDSFRLLRGTKEELDLLPESWVMGRKDGQYQTEALIRLTPENKAIYSASPVPDLAAILYYLEGGE